MAKRRHGFTLTKPLLLAATGIVAAAGYMSFGHKNEAKAAPAPKEAGIIREVSALLTGPTYEYSYDKEFYPRVPQDGMSGEAILNMSENPNYEYEQNEFGGGEYVSKEPVFGGTETVIEPVDQNSARLIVIKQKESNRIDFVWQTEAKGGVNVKHITFHGNDLTHKDPKPTFFDYKNEASRVPAELGSLASGSVVIGLQISDIKDQMENLPSRATVQWPSHLKTYSKGSLFEDSGLKVKGLAGGEFMVSNTTADGTWNYRIQSNGGPKLLLADNPVPIRKANPAGAGLHR